MMIKKNLKIRNFNEKGAALLVVLFIIMAITVLSLGYLARCDVELACGENMALRTQMDYLAESGLEHARGLILNPQEISSEYWTGGVGQQIVSGSDFYDVGVVSDGSDPMNYTIDCNAYRLKNGEKIGQSGLTAQLRLDPCIAYWCGSNTTISQRVTINGDVYCAGSLSNSGIIDGDVFAGGSITGGNITGRKNASSASPPIYWPDVQISDFSASYYVRSTVYFPDVISAYLHTAGSFLPSTSNPGGVRYRDGDVELPGNVNITGLLVVNGNLFVSSVNNTVTAVKNFPALLVSGDVIVKAGGKLDVSGLAIINQQLKVSSDSASVNIFGGLCAKNGIAETVWDSSGNDNTGNVYSSPTWRPSGGRTAGALEFDGADDYVQTANSTTKLQLTGDYTLSVWIKPDATQKSCAGVFSKCSPDGSTNHWTLQFDTSSPGKLIVYHTSTKCWDTGIRITDIAGAWHHIAVVRSGNAMKSYLDGIVRNNGTWNNAPGSGDGHLNIGVERNASSTYVYKGLIDDIRVYNCPMDVNNIYPPRDGLPGLIGHWRLDEAGSSTTISAAPTKTALLIWSSGGTVKEKWESTAGAFFRSIQKR